MRMINRIPSTAAVASVCAVALLSLVIACGEVSEEERVVKARSRYEATLNNFIVKQVPLVEEPAADPFAEGAEAVEEAGEEPAAGAGDPTVEVEDAEVVVEVPVRQDVVVDLTIRHESDVPLDGLTVDFFMGDGTTDIRNWKVWFDTTEVQANTPGVQFSHTFENIDYQEGYGFRAEIVSPVPEADRHLYREFEGL